LTSRRTSLIAKSSLAAGAIVCLLLLAGCGGSGPAADAIVFVSSRDGDYAIYGMNADGSGQGRLTEEHGDTSTLEGVRFQTEPAWSPDGSRIAFASAREGSFDIYVMNANGTGTMGLTSSRKENDRHPTWSPDGSRIAFSRFSDIDHVYVMKSDGNGARRLTDDNLATEGEPSWSPDGRWIAYTHRASGSDSQEIWVVHPDGSGRRAVTQLKAKSYTPAWAPDSKRLAFSSNRDGAVYNIYTIGVDGKGVRRIGNSATDAFEPAWSPSGDEIAFSRDGAIVVTTLAGVEKQLTDPENNDSSPAWKPAPGAAKEGS
jgi:Tol biopolymer transport system component